MEGAKTTGARQSAQWTQNHTSWKQEPLKEKRLHTTCVRHSCDTRRAVLRVACGVSLRKGGREEGRKVGEKEGGRGEGKGRRGGEKGGRETCVANRAQLIILGIQPRLELIIIDHELQNPEQGCQNSARQRVGHSRDSLCHPPCHCV